jgi:hypothetical protein
MYNQDGDVKVAQPEPRSVPRTEQEIRDDLTRNPDITHLKKILAKDSNLYFYIKQANENDKSKSWKSAWFRITLLEDLFLYSNQTWKGKDLIKSGKFRDCACIVDRGTYDNNDPVPFFEQIYAKSVNAVYKKTHVHYFGNEGSPNANVFDTIYFKPQKDKNFLLNTKRGFGDDNMVHRCKVALGEF